MKTDLFEQIQAARDFAGWLHRPDLCTLEVKGKDAERFLNGMLSNDTKKLMPMMAQRAVKATPKGKVEGVVRLRRTDESFLLDVRESSAGRVRESLAKLLVMDEAAIEDVTPTRKALTVLGPSSGTALLKLGMNVQELYQHWCEQFSLGFVARDDWMGLQSFDIFAPTDTFDPLVEKLAESGASEISFEALNVLRVEHGAALDGVDVDDDTLPMEARLEDTLDFEKGCYVGQETIARATNLGGVKHILVGLRFSGDEMPEAGAEVLVGEEETGELTSVVRSPVFGVIGLGYVRTKHQAPGTEARVRFSGKVLDAQVSGLPFEA